MVLQEYVRNPQDPQGPVMQLRGYKRLNVKTGETATANFLLTPKSFEWFDEQTNTICTKPGTYDVLYGNSSKGNALKKVTVTIN